MTHDHQTQRLLDAFAALRKSLEAWSGYGYAKITVHPDDAAAIRETSKLRWPLQMPISVMPSPDLAAAVALKLVDCRLGSFSPGMSNEMTVRSFEVEKLARAEPDDKMRTEMLKYAYVLRYAGEMSFAVSGAVVARLGQLVSEEHQG